MAFGSLKGTFSGSATSITNPFTASTLVGSGAVVPGDLVLVVVSEQTSNTSTSATDSASNTYTAVNAGSDAGTVTSRAFFHRVTAAATLTSVSVAATASANNVVLLAAIIEGPFASSPLHANPADITNDTTTPYTCPSTGTLPQNTEVVLCWTTHNGNVTLTATAPNLKAVQLNTATVLTGAIGYQTVSTTTTVSPEWTSSGTPTADVLGTAAFGADLTVPPQSYVQANQGNQPRTQDFKAKGFAVALMAAGLIWSPFVEAAAPAEEILIAETNTIVPHVRTMLYPSLQEPVFVEAAEVVTSDKWYTPAWTGFRRKDQRYTYPSLQEPTPIVVEVPPGTGDVETASAELVVQYSKTLLYPSLQEPVRVVEVELVTLDKWYAPLSQPTYRIEKRHLYPTLQQAIPVVETVTLDKWYSPLSQPKFLPTRPVYQQYLVWYPNNVSGTGTELQPIPPLAQPTYRKDQRSTYPTLQEPTAIVTFEPGPGTFLDPIVPTNQPTRRKDQRSTYPTLFDPVPVIVQTADRWAPPLSQPTRRKDQRNIYQALQQPVAAVEVVTLDKWFTPPSQPTHRKDRRSTYPTLFQPLPIIVEVDKWYRPLSQPTYRKDQRSTYPALFGPLPVIVRTADQWAPPLSQPTRSKEHRHLYPTLFVPTPVVVQTADRWAPPLSQPTRRKDQRSTYPTIQAAVPIVSFAGDATRLDVFPSLVVPVRRIDWRHTWPSIQAPVDFHIPEIVEEVQNYYGIGHLKLELAELALKKLKQVERHRWISPNEAVLRRIKELEAALAERPSDPKAPLTPLVRDDFYRGKLRRIELLERSLGDQSVPAATVVVANRYSLAELEKIIDHIDALDFSLRSGLGVKKSRKSALQIKRRKLSEIAELEEDLKSPSPGTPKKPR